MTEFRDMTQEERQRLRVERMLGETGPERAYRMLLEKEADEIAGLKPVYLVERSETGEVKSVRALHLERYQAAKEAEARERERIEKLVPDEPAAYDNGLPERLLAKVMMGTAQRPELQWQKELTPEALEEMLEVMERQRKADEELAERAFEALMNAVSYLSAATGMTAEPTEHKIRRLMERVAEVAAKGVKLVYLHRTGGHCVICGKKLKVSCVCRECMEAWVGK